MSRQMEVHILQNFAPSNLNRDDTGSPKDALFGGSRRARVSSQCFKRAMRQRFAVDSAGELPPEHLATRTQRVRARLTELLQERGRSEENVGAIITTALAGVGLKLDDEGMSQYLLFLGARELTRVAELIDEHWDALAGVAPDAEEGKTGSAAKRAARGKVPKPVSDAMLAALDGGKALDIALFGRMLADLPQKNQDAAAQVAHAISTHRVEREFDFYTAVDDLNPAADTGAGMLGTVEFTSACFYRYAALHLDLLASNLQRDDELAASGVRAFLRAMASAVPTGKQNSFAAHNLPAFIGVTVRENALPRNLVNAFEKPVHATSEKALTHASVECLVDEWVKLDAAYGAGDSSSEVYLNLTKATTDPLDDAGAHEAASLDELIDAVDAAVGR